MTAPPLPGCDALVTVHAPSGRRRRVLLRDVARRIGNEGECISTGDHGGAEIIACRAPGGPAVGADLSKFGRVDAVQPEDRALEVDVVSPSTTVWPVAGRPRSRAVATIP